MLTVIIVNWNAGDFLDRCLGTVYAGNLNENLEVIVVDNNSTDRSAEVICEKYPQVKLIGNRQNVGFARANNQALKEVSGDLVLLLNPDTEIEPDTLRVMADFIRNRPDCGIAGCKVLNPDGTLQQACRRNIPTMADAFFKLTGLSRLFPGSPRFSRYNLTFLPADQIAAVDAVSGSFMMARREVVERIGLLDDRFFMYGEDLDGVCGPGRPVIRTIICRPRPLFIIMVKAAGSAPCAPLTIFIRPCIFFIASIRPRHGPGRWSGWPHYLLSWRRCPKYFG